MIIEITETEFVMIRHALVRHEESRTGQVTLNLKLKTAKQPEIYDVKQAMMELEDKLVWEAQR